MFRGSRTTTLSWVIRMVTIGAACIGLTQAALGRSDSRRGDAVTGKLVAPNMEDHASYFSVHRRDVSAADQKRADDLRLKTINSINALLEANKNNSVRYFELLLRLGELYVERHDYIRDRELDTYGKAYDAWAALPKDKRGQEPVVNYSGSQNELTMAANAFRRLVMDFPKHPRTDAALYALAKTLARLGRDTSVEYYKQLLKSYPKSPLVPDTYLSLGEYYFDKHQVNEALENYKKVMSYKEHRAYPYAVYKLGWAYYNVDAKTNKQAADNLNKTVAAFKLVIKLSSEKNTVANNLNLRDEAIRDLIMVWAEAGDVASAWKYFRTIGEQDSFYKMLERLGNIYYDQGKNSQAIAVFRRLLKEAPNRANNPEVYARLLELYDTTNNLPMVVEELKNMQKIYLQNSPWTVANKGNAESLANAQRLVELSAHRYGTMFHQRGQKTKSDAYLQAAAAIYALYLQSFPKNPNSYDIRYYLAEILYDSKQFEAASDHYLIVAKQDPKGKYHKASALNAVAAINQVVTTSSFDKLPPPGQVTQPIAIPRTKKKLADTIDAYVAFLPQDKEGHAMRFTAAQIYFDHGHYPEAIKRFENITKEIPETSQAKTSARMVLGFYSDKGDWSKLITWGRSFLNNPKLLDNDLKTHLANVMRTAMFNRSIAQEKAGDFDKAARGFLEFQKEFPADPNADRALYNAAINFNKVGRVENALAAGTLLIQTYPKSSLQPDVLADMASTYEAMAQFDMAAENYKRLALNFPADKRAPSALYNAAVLYKGLNKFNDAVVLFKEFAQRFGNLDLAADATLELASLQERMQLYGDAVATYNSFSRKFLKDSEKAFFASAKAASLTAFHVNKVQGQNDLRKLRQQLVAQNAPTAFEARTTIGEALFKLAEPTFGEFQALKVTDSSKLERELGAKQAKLVELANAYEAIIELGSGEHTVAALYRLGEAHENFANALFRAPAPQGASQVDLDKYRTQLEKVAFPLKEEAYKFFETAFKRSREVQTFTVWTQRTYQKMVELSPEKHPIIDELSADPSYLSHDMAFSKALAGFVKE